MKSKSPLQIKFEKVITMNIKNILFLIFVSSLLIGSACAAGVGDFDISKDYKQCFADDYHTLYMNKDQDSGIAIYKNADDDAYADTDADEAYDDIVHDDAKEYLTADDDMTIDKKSDNTAEFKDVDDHAEHGIVEVVKKDGDEYVVVFWAKDSSNVKNSDLQSVLKDFNKDNDVEAISF